MLEQGAARWLRSWAATLSENERTSKGVLRSLSGVFQTESFSDDFPGSSGFRTSVTIHREKPGTVLTDEEETEIDAKFWVELVRLTQSRPVWAATYLAIHRPAALAELIHEFDVASGSRLTGSNGPAFDRALQRFEQKCNDLERAVIKLSEKHLKGSASAGLPKTRRGMNRLVTTSVKDQRILAALREGKSYRAVAKEVDIGHSTVGRVAKEYGLTGHAPGAVPLGGTLEDKLTVRVRSGKKGASRGQ